ncbi:7-cyano-7-deazaguanine synthase [Gordonia sp. i37]|uniref:7-cyano-7-deazaguanine synthase n=1 Tax=Gordonia sp. i37 TaxID=1961707 RepID=UPI0009ADE2BA|nr:7-cyano-7-deazaguanine synthase [Gordonia sp. i37]OPX13520.1 hypothetical protein B1964_19730 [Gordonia sp. i37]
MTVAADTTPPGTSGVLLLSGGLDSTALAAILRPTLCLAIAYGQRPAAAETRAAAAVCRELDLDCATITLDLAAIGSGLLLDDGPAPPDAASPEWWPFRNQLLVTAAAAVALNHGLHDVYIGTVAGDGERHADGTQAFYDALNTVMAVQEGAVKVHTPAIGCSTTDLLRRSGLGPSQLGWTTSCHRSDTPCGACPGCWKRHRVLADLQILDQRDERS